MSPPTPASSRRSARRAAALLVAMLFALVSGCGFHLRGTRAAAGLPSQLATLKITIEEPAAAGHPLRRMVQQLLEVRDGVTLAPPSAEVPELIIGGEVFDRRVMSVSGATAKVSEYLLRYRVGFRVVDAAGAALLAPQTVSLRREYRFDPQNVLAKEQEETELRRNLREEAARLIVLRLAGMSKADGARP